MQIWQPSETIGFRYGDYVFIETYVLVLALKEKLVKLENQHFKWGRSR